MAACCISGPLLSAGEKPISYSSSSTTSTLLRISPTALATTGQPRYTTAPPSFSVGYQTALIPTPTKVTGKGEHRPPLSHVWRSIQGAEDWDGLVEPLDSLLRDEILRYGDLVDTCYKAFDLDPASRRYLKCKHGKSRILEESCTRGCATGYVVTKYVYATPDVPRSLGRRSRWVGHVSVSTDLESRRLGRRDVLVALRGTVTGAEWAASLSTSLIPARFDPNDPRPDIRVAAGVLGLYTAHVDDGQIAPVSCREQLLHEVARLVATHASAGEDVSVTLAGHSAGSSLAVLLGYDLAELGLNRGAPVTVYSFAGPRVGNPAFRDRCNELGVKVLRIANVRDPITRLPGVVLNETSCKIGEHQMPWESACYAHVGVELSLDFFPKEKPWCVHDIGHYLEALAPQSDGNKILTTETTGSRHVEMRNSRPWPWQAAVGNLVQYLRS